MRHFETAACLLLFVLLTGSVALFGGCKRAELEAALDTLKHHVNHGKLLTYWHTSALIEEKCPYGTCACNVVIDFSCGVGATLLGNETSVRCACDNGSRWTDFPKCRACHKIRQQNVEDTRIFMYPRSTCDQDHCACGTTVHVGCDSSTHALTGGEAMTCACPERGNGSWSFADAEPKCVRKDEDVQNRKTIKKVHPRLIIGLSLGGIVLLLLLLLLIFCYVCCWMQINKRDLTSPVACGLLTQELTALQMIPPHANIVRFLGYSDDPTYGRTIVTELLPHDNLKRFLKEQRTLPPDVPYANLHPESVTLTGRQLVGFAHQVAGAMRHIVHHKVRVRAV
ncbi:PREDICTED: uncharacterized protein LOC106809432 [Priapulus caudatus]|uniref:Uncharacterized protein LOC106809432 n=1 Tax=Priapulus caudatus TaxID=37621 RepID=A0ABM1E728_PRICU|nr:PREDICTED: uncharacterized protein LOC106809432 [Priapulus caudatus]